MKLLLILSLILLNAPSAFAVAQTEYQCGPYKLELFGPEVTRLWDSKGKLLGEWEEDGEEPTFYKTIKGKEVLHIRWQDREFKCKVTQSSP